MRPLRRPGAKLSAPRRQPEVERSQDQSAARHLRRARRGGRPCARRSRRTHARSSRARATSGSRRPTFEATELFARGVGESTDIVAQGDVHLRRRRRALADAAPGGHRARLPGLRRTRHAQAPPAGEAVVPVELLPPRARAGRTLPAVLAGRRRGARLRGSGPRRRVDRAAVRAARARSGSRDVQAAPVEPRQPREQGRVPRTPEGPPAGARREPLGGGAQQDRAEPPARLRLRPRGHAGV